MSFNFNIKVPRSNLKKIQDYFTNSTCRKHIAIYDTFNGIKNAEYELIQRFGIACKKINVGLLMIRNNNIIQNPELFGVDIDEIDMSKICCVISLHPLSNKTSKHFTIMTLWNPIKFHASESWRNVFTMDGYVSSYSDNIDNFVKSNTTKPFLGYMNTTLCDPIMNFTFGDYKCFYVGINWDKVSLNRKKVNDLVKKMNDMEIISIYGPNRDKCWDNYKTYMGEIDFDGKSVVYKIHECGICLVLSSENHIEDSVCSNRLFEGLAAGVPIISDKNPFIQKWFGDNIFYIDNDDIEKASEKICEYITFFKENPEKTLEKMKNCREIFLTHFLLDTQLSNLIENITLLRK